LTGGFLRWPGQLEVDDSAQDPVFNIGSFLGITEILKLREEYKERLDDHCSLSEFHARLLKIRNMSPALIA